MDENKAEQIFAIHRKIVELSSMASASNLLRGQFFYEARKDDNFKLIAGEDATWKSYCADPEIGLSTTSVNKYIDVYEKYVLELGIPIEELYGIDINKLKKVSEVITTENKEEWFSKMKTLSRSDIYRMFEHPDQDVMTCEHKWKNHKQKCTVCGEVKGV